MSNLPSPNLLKDSIATFISILKKNNPKCRITTNAPALTKIKRSQTKCSTLPDIFKHNLSYSQNNQLPKSKTTSSELIINLNCTKIKQDKKLSCNESPKLSNKPNASYALKTQKLSLIRKNPLSINRENNHFESSTHSCYSKMCVSPVVNRSNNLYEEKTISLTQTRLSLSMSPANAASVSEDPFHFANMIKNSCFSPFHSILDGQNEYTSNPFPYCSRIAKQVNLKTIIKKKKKLKPLPTYACRCAGKFRILSGKEEQKIILPKVYELKRKVPFLSRVHFYPQRVQSFRNLIILNFEGTFGHNKQGLIVKKGTWKILKVLSSFFQLILVISNRGLLRDKLTQVFDEKGVKLAGIYISYCTNKVSREIEKVQNYSQIYEDFDCMNPSKNCAIISCHRLADFSENMNDFIYRKQGTGLKLNSEKVPVVCQEYPVSPFVILLPSFDISTDLNFLNEITEKIALIMQNFKSYKETFDFSEFFKNSDFKIIASHAPQSVVVETLLGNFYNCDPDKEDATVLEKNFIMHCKIHNRYYVKYSKCQPLTYFVIDNNLHF